MIGIAALAAGVTWLAVKGRPGDTAPTYRLRQITRGDGISTTPALSPDGTLLAYASNRGGENNLDIWVQQVAGGDPIRITHHRADEVRPQFSPDGSQIIFLRQGSGLYVVPSLGGTERLIAGNGLSGSYSPDGKWLAYCTGFPGSRELFGLYVQPTAGGAPRKLKTGLAGFNFPTWSPDSQHILLTGSTTVTYTFRGSFGQDWYVLPAAGGKAVKVRGWENLEQAGISETSPRAWMKNGSVLFSATHGGVRNIWQMPMEKETWTLAGVPRRVTAGAGEFPGMPSLDGRIPYATGSGDMSIYSMAIDPRQGKTSGGLIPVVHDGSNTVFPTLTRDGTKLAYASDRSGNDDIWIKDLQSGAEAPVVATPARERRGIISPDGSQLAFIRAERTGQMAYLWPLPAGPERMLCEKCGPMLNFGILSWSPDGKSVLMAEGDPQRFEALDVATGQRTLLVKHEKYAIHDGNLSPDGRWLAFKLVTSASIQPVYVAPVGGGTPAREKDWIKISGDFNQTKPFWSPGGDLLYYFSTKDSFDCLYARRLDPATKRPLADAFAVRHFHEDLRPPNGTFTGYGLAADRLYLTLATARSNVWLAEPEKR